MYADRFTMMQTQKQLELQPECPIYVHCTRRCEDRYSGSMFLQVRMVNRSDSVVKTVILCVEGLDVHGAVVYKRDELFLTDCDAQPHQIFGENKIISIDRTPVERVRVCVQRVMFFDGMMWRRMPEQRLISEESSRWKTCKCGMRNPPQQKNCELCGRAFIQAVQRLDQMPHLALEDIPKPMEAEKSVKPFDLSAVNGAKAATLSAEMETGGKRNVRFRRLFCIFALIAIMAILGYIISQYFIGVC